MVRWNSSISSGTRLSTKILQRRFLSFCTNNFGTKSAFLWQEFSSPETREELIALLLSGLLMNRSWCVPWNDDHYLDWMDRMNRMTTITSGIWPILPNIPTVCCGNPTKKFELQWKSYFIEEGLQRSEKHLLVQRSIHICKNPVVNSRLQEGV